MNTFITEHEVLLETTKTSSTNLIRSILLSILPLDFRTKE